MDTLFEHRFGLFHESADKDDCGGSTVADFIVLRTCNLYHHLCPGVLHSDLPEDCRAVVGDNNITGRPYEHFVHTPGAKC